MQYLLTEEEFKSYKRCKQFVEGGYEQMLKTEVNKPISEIKKKWFEYCLGYTDKIPNIMD